jgi:hypothetical protein
MNVLARLGTGILVTHAVLKGGGAHIAVAD